MASPYDVALRQRAVLAYERGEGSYADVATLLDVHGARWNAGWRGGAVAESVEPAPRGSGWRSPTDIAALRILAREVPDAAVAEMCAEYNRRVERTSPASFHRSLVREGCVNKKPAAAK